LGATQEADEPALPASSVSVWYRWTAPSTGQVTLTTSGALTTTVAAYSGTAVGSLTFLGDNVFQAQAGHEYSIALYGAPAAGTTTLNWSLVVGASADIQMSVTAPPSPSYQDDGLEFIVNVFNAGPNAAANVVVTDVLPSDTVANQSLPHNCTADATTVSCSLGTINANQTKTVSIPLRSLLAPQIVSNAIDVSTATPDPMTSNNSSTSVVNVLPGGTIATGDVPTAPQWALILLSILLFSQVISSRSVVSRGKPD
jgi:uncharacterized repeat protein (TIGR01451 family)